MHNDRPVLTLRKQCLESSDLLWVQRSSHKMLQESLELFDCEDEAETYCAST